MVFGETPALAIAERKNLHPETWSIFTIDTINKIATNPMTNFMFD